MRIASIEALFTSRCPSAIVGLIVAVIVDTINRVLWRRFRSHVGVKILKGFSPAFTNTNASTAVPLIADLRGPLAPIEQRPPAFIFRRQYAATTVTVRQGLGIANVASQASAALRSLLDKFSGSHDTRRGAIAGAQPAADANWPDYGEASEALADRDTWSLMPDSDGLLRSLQRPSGSEAAMNGGATWFRHDAGLYQTVSR